MGKYVENGMGGVKRYLTDKWSPRGIKIISVIRETEKCYYVPGYRPGKENRRMKDANYHETWAAARAAVIEMTERMVGSAQAKLDSAQNDLTRALLIPEQEVQHGEG